MTDDIIKACEFLERGKIILYPTDTVWGIGCDATDSYAVKRIYEIKHRSDSKALIVLSDSIDNIADYLAPLSKETELLLN
ncbi:L-threonylcarbamoyladenylate synthase, partial [uncultured Muribaculum sp.]